MANGRAALISIKDCRLSIIFIYVAAHNIRPIGRKSLEFKRSEASLRLIHCTAEINYVATNQERDWFGGPSVSVFERRPPLAARRSTSLRIVAMVIEPKVARAISSIS